jgi:hypothetical protein
LIKTAMAGFAAMIVLRLLGRPRLGAGRRNVNEHVETRAPTATALAAAVSMAVPISLARHCGACHGHRGKDDKRHPFHGMSPAKYSLRPISAKDIAVRFAAGSISGFGFPSENGRPKARRTARR